MARRRRVRDVTVGSLFALALIVVALAVMAVGGESGLWFKRSEFQIVFADGTGLLVGAPVRMAGVEIGTVSSVRLPENPAEQGIEVAIGIAADHAPRLRQDSRAALRILQFLTNEKYVEITPGSPGQPPLAPGSTIPLLEEVGVVEQGEAIAENLNEITASLKKILDPLERGEGLVGKMLHDPEFGTSGVESLGGTLENIEELTEQLTTGQGTLGRLLYDEQLGAKLDNLGQAIEDFSELVASLSESRGALGELLAPGGPVRQAVSDLGDSAAALKRLTTRLEQDEGILGRLLNDPEFSEAVAADLAATLRDVAEITDKINQGEGSLGALVNERVLYDGAEDVVAGVNDSKFARWLLRHYRKKGIKAGETAVGTAEKAPGGGSEPAPGP